MDPMGHPDLVRLGRSLRNRLDEIDTGIIDLIAERLEVGS